MRGEGEDLEQVTAPVSCTEAILSYNKQPEWRSGKMGSKIYRMERYARHETRGGVRGREHNCPMRFL